MIMTSVKMACFFWQRAVRYSRLSVFNSDALAIATSSPALTDVTKRNLVGKKVTTIAATGLPRLKTITLRKCGHMMDMAVTKLHRTKLQRVVDYCP